jgi:hypothetical protein
MTVPNEEGLRTLWGKGYVSPGPDFWKTDPIRISSFRCLRIYRELSLWRETTTDTFINFQDWRRWLNRSIPSLVVTRSIVIIIHDGFHDIRNDDDSSQLSF